MRTWAILIAISLTLPVFGGETEIRIDALVSVPTIREVIRQIRKIDKRPILSISQRKKEQDPKEVPLLYPMPSDIYDIDSLIVVTGVQSGPVNGGGGCHYFRRVRAHWVLTKSEGWVS